MWKYLTTGDPKHRERVTQDETDFRSFRAEHGRLMLTVREKELDQQIDARFERFIHLGRSLMNTRDAQHALLALATKACREIDELLDERIQPNLASESPDGCAKLTEASAIEADAAEVNAWLAVYASAPSDRHRRDIAESLRELREHDEMQVVPGWESFVRRILDSEKVEVFLSGSSAALLSREIATAMRGRAWEVVIHPFSFEEYLRHRELAVPKRPDAMSSRERSSLERAFLDYVVSGGFPEAQGLAAETRQRLLRDYVDVAMLRDVVERHNVSNVAGLRWLVRHILGNAGGLFSAEKFYAALKSQGLSISKDTLHQLLAHLDDCFLVRTVWVESESERRRMSNPRKAYPVDPGLIPVFDRTGRTNLGHALETLVLIELERRRMSVTYVRTPAGHEVDFLARTATGDETLIQVCADPTSAETLERELRALDEAGAMFPNAERLLLTLTRDTVPSELPAGVVAQPAYEWLLGAT